MTLSTAPQIDALIASHTADVHHSLPRILVSAASSSALLYLGLGGTSQLPATPFDPPGPALKPEDIFMMASCTKLVTTVAVLQLVDRGLFTLDSDARELLPELAAVERLDGFDADDRPVLVENGEAITVRMLLTHTAGFSYTWGSPNKQQEKYAKQHGIKAISDPTGDRSAIAGVPLDFVPGAKWLYSTSLDWAGFLVEHVTGQDLEDYFQEHIFGPLSITDISFTIPATHLNLAYRQTPHLSPPTFLPGPPLHWSAAYRLAGGGLYGSAPSFLRLLQHLLPSAPPTLLSPALRGQMYERQLATDGQRADVGQHCQFDLSPWAREAMPEPSAGVDWGLGGARMGVDLEHGRREGSLCWSGLAGTYWVLDPKTNLAFVIWSNILPYGDQAIFDLWKEVEPLIYAGLPRAESI